MTVIDINDSSAQRGSPAGLRGTLKTVIDRPERRREKTVNDSSARKERKRRPGDLRERKKEQR